MSPRGTARIRLVLPAALALALASAGCGRDARGEADRYLRAYNAALVEAYRSSDASKLEGLAGTDEVRKVRILIDLKSSNGIVLESRLERFEVTAATFEGDDRIAAETREEWRYHDRPRSPGLPPGPEFRSEMTLRYRLVREAGTWKVEGVRALSSRPVEPPPENR